MCFVVFFLARFGEWGTQKNRPLLCMIKLNGSQLHLKVTDTKMIRLMPLKMVPESEKKKQNGLTMSTCSHFNGSPVAMAFAQWTHRDRRVTQRFSSLSLSRKKNERRPRAGVSWLDPWSWCLYDLSIRACEPFFHNQSIPWTHSRLRVQ